MKKNVFKGVFIVLTLVIVALIAMMPVLAAMAAPAPDGAEAAETAVLAATDNSTSSKAMSAAIVVGIAAAAGAIGMGLAIAKSVDGIARQPEAEGKIRTTLMLGLVFVETAIIYALVIAILIIFVL